MPKSALILFICSVIGFVTPVFAQKGSRKEFKKENYQINYPENWTLDTSNAAASFIIFSPLSSDTDEFKENLNLVVQDLSGLNFDLDNFTALSEQQIQNYMEESDLTQNERLKKGNQEYQHLIYTAKSGGKLLRFEQYYWIINEKAYVLTFTAELQYFDQYKSISKEILDSFELN